MHVKEDGAIAFAKLGAINAAERTVNRFQNAGRYMPWNDWIRNTRQAAVPQVHVGATHFRTYGTEQRGAVWHVGAVELAYLNRPPRTGHDSGKDAVTHGVRYPLARLRVETQARPSTLRCLIDC